jgi:Domain of unknown function (DUF4389)
MSTAAFSAQPDAIHPVQVHVEPATHGRNRVTTVFRLVLAVPHLILVGGPVAATCSWVWRPNHGRDATWGGATGGVLGAVAGVIAVIAWFAILFTGRYPNGLRDLAAFYLRWRARAMAYVALLRDEYPPFGDGPYPVTVELELPGTPRDKLTVAFRIFLAIPHLVVLWFIGVAWFCTTIIAWFAILLTGQYPGGLYQFGVGALRWNIRVEAYLLLLHDVYPPFSLG